MDFRIFRRAAFLLACLLLAGGGPGALMAASGLPADDSQLRASAADIHVLAARLNDAPEPLRADFALAVLSEMIQVYRQEGERARAEVRLKVADRDLLRWSRAVTGMVADLQRLADSLSPSTPVFVSTLYADTVYLVVDGSPVLLTGPRRDENASLERRVLQRFCSRNDCGDLLAEAQETETASSRVEETLLWRFDDTSGPVCATGDGLEFQFRDASGLQEKRQACSRIVAELNALAVALNLKIDSGTPVDWNRLRVRPATDSGVQRVVLNGDGDYLLMSAPSLESAPELFSLVLPWLAARVAGVHYNLVVLNTERLLRLPGQPVD